MTSLNDLLEEIGAVVGSRVTACYEAARSGDIRHSGADIGRARTVLGFEPTISLRTGLAETLAVLRA